MRPLYSLAALRIVGTDARTFLQGQLSNDLALLSADKSLLACCNSAQGRVQVILRLIERTDGIYAVLPRSMVDTTVARLRKYQLRAKLTVEPAADSTQLFWVSVEELAEHGFAQLPGIGEHQQRELISVFNWGDANQPRYVMLQPGSPITNSEVDKAWQLADIRAGLPQVLPETHEHFVAQMLNLEALDAISFNKGCYTGQEIIARAHFRGTVKRTMVRNAARCAPPLPGTKLLAGADAAGEVVVAAEVADGCEFLAVVSISNQELELILEGSASAVNRLPLPYAASAPH